MITVALLNFKNDDQGPRDFVGLHHIGFWVDEIRKAEVKVEAAGGSCLSLPEMLKAHPKGAGVRLMG